MEEDQILYESNDVIQADSNADGNHVKGRIYTIGNLRSAVNLSSC